MGARLALVCAQNFPRASNPKEHSLQLTCELMFDLRLNITLRTDLDLSRNITIDSFINYVLKKYKIKG